MFTTDETFTMRDVSPGRPHDLTRHSSKCDSVNGPLKEILQTLVILFDKSISKLISHFVQCYLSSNRASFI
jgi:hypothetical protein